MVIITKEEALLNGLKKYFTGIPCTNQHISERYTRDGACCMCRSNIDRNIRLKDNHIERNRKWRNDVNYYQRRKDVINAKNKIWRENNPHKLREYSNLRNTLLSQCIPTWFEEDLVKRLYLKRDELNERWGTNFQVDHIIPLNPKDKSVCGLHCWANLQLLDASLNGGKRDIYQTDW